MYLCYAGLHLLLISMELLYVHKKNTKRLFIKPI